MVVQFRGEWLHLVVAARSAAYRSGGASASSWYAARDPSCLAVACCRPRRGALYCPRCPCRTTSTVRVSAGCLANGTGLVLGVVKLVHRVGTGNQISSSTSLRVNSPPVLRAAQWCFLTPRGSRSGRSYQEPPTQVGALTGLLSISHTAPPVQSRPDPLPARQRLIVWGGE